MALFASAARQINANRYRHPKRRLTSRVVSNAPEPVALKLLTGAVFKQYTVFMYSNNKSVKKHMPPLQSARILDQLRERIRYLHYSLRTEEAYVYWVRGYIRFHLIRHPSEMGAPEVEGYLSWLANERKVAASTHKQALAALLFLYVKVLCVDMPWLKEIGSPRLYKRLPGTAARSLIPQRRSARCKAR